MENITYLFGAGASAPVIPVVDGIRPEMEKLIEYLKKDELQLTDNQDFQHLKGVFKRNLQQNLIKDLQWLYAASEGHASVDTLAKKLYLTKKEHDLNRLKLTLSVFFAFVQVGKTPNNRYDSFFASLLTKDIRAFPDNVRLLSWNYDQQFEIAYSEYSGDSRSLSFQDNLPIVSKYIYKEAAKDKFGFYKLNGSAGLVTYPEQQQYHFVESFKTELSTDVIEQIVSNYSTVRHPLEKVRSSLSFAWEQDNGTLDILKEVKEAVKETSVLVVIGYSFPFFNRSVDREIIKNMPQVRKVYFQSLEAAAIKERFQAIRDDIKDDKLLLKNDVKQFFLPDEL